MELSLVICHNVGPSTPFYDREPVIKKKELLNSQFPFCQSTFPILLDNHKTIKQGVVGALHDYINGHGLVKEVATVIEGPKNARDVSENVGGQRASEKTATAKAITLLKSSMKLSSPTTTDINLVVAIKKLTSLIRDVVSDSDPYFREIHNYVINSVIQNFATSDAPHICSKILSKSYRSTLLETIDELVKDKYGEIKLNGFVDTCAAVFLESVDPINYDNPNLYGEYTQIWNFDHHEYKHYGKQFFLDSYFSQNSARSTPTQADTYFQNAFMMNIPKFMFYFCKTPRPEQPEHSVSYEHLEVKSPLDDAMSVRYISDLDLSTLRSTTPELFDAESPVSSEYSGKSIRFDDIIEVLEINKLEPAYYVHCDLNNILVEACGHN